MSIIVNKDSDPFNDLRKKKGYRKHVIERLTGEAEKNQGKIILSYREILGGYDGVAGCISYPRPVYTTCFEAGILNGIPCEAESKRGWNQIPLMRGFSGHGSDTYMYMMFSSGVAIPVMNKVVSSNLHLGVSDLEKMSERGQLEMDFLEFFSEKGDILNSPTPPYLTNFALLFGEEEIREFVENHKKYVSRDNLHSLVGISMDGKKIDEFLNLMQNPKKAQGKIDIHYYDERVNLSTELIEHVSHLNGLSERLFNMRDDILNLYTYYQLEQGGREHYWSNLNTVNDYRDLKGDALNQINSIRGILNKKGNLNLRKLPKISGGTLGFPADIGTKEYLNYIDEMIFPVEGMIGEMSEHVAHADANPS